VAPNVRVTAYSVIRKGATEPTHWSEAEGGGEGAIADNISGTSVALSKIID